MMIQDRHRRVKRKLIPENGINLHDTRYKMKRYGSIHILRTGACMIHKLNPTIHMGSWYIVGLSQDIQDFSRAGAVSIYCGCKAPSAQSTYTRQRVNEAQSNIYPRITNVDVLMMRETATTRWKSTPDAGKFWWQYTSKMKLRVRDYLKSWRHRKTQYSSDWPKILGR